MFMSPFVAEQGGPPVGPGTWYLGPWPAPYDGVAPIDAANVVAAYQPKAATGSIYERTVANYAASLVNIANPGAHDAITGVLPSWAAATGWFGPIFPVRCFLITDIVPDTQNAAYFASYSGFYDGLTNISLLGGSGVLLHRTVGMVRAGNYSPIKDVTGGTSNGVLGVNKETIYLNGIAIDILLAPPPALTGDALYLLGNNLSGVNNFGVINMYCESIAIYKPGITPAQAAAVSWAMEVIRNA
jgi:hypothetical protein